MLFSLAMPLALMSQTSGNFNPVTLEGRILGNDKGGFVSEIQISIAKGYYLYATAPKSMPYTLAHVDIQLPASIKQKGKLIKPKPVQDPDDPKIGIYTGEVRFVQPISDSAGRAHSRSDYRGKYVLIDFWKYGCIPCIEQFPKLRELYAGYQSKGFEILGVFHCVFEGNEKNRKEWISLMRKEHPTWTGLIDYDDEVCQAYGVEAFPSNFLLGPDGKVITFNIEPHQLSIWLENSL